jgi:Fe-S-cluster containining protein
MSATCNGCGHCCNPVILDKTKREYQMQLPETEEGKANRRFVLDCLTLLPAAEGHRRAQYLFDPSIELGVSATVGGEPTVAVFFYECKNYDPDERKCLDWENRPPVCRGFPWYDGPPRREAVLPPECSFIEDIPVKLRHPMYHPKPTTEEPPNG